MLKELFSTVLIPESLMIPLFLVIGIGGLYYGAEFLVKGASEFALHFKIKPVIIGLTVVAFGTSAPEFMVSLIAAFQEEADVSVGNIVGSNIANIGLIIGLTAALVPVTRTSKPSRFEFLSLAGASVLLIVFSLGGWIDRVEGLALFSLLIVFLVLCYRHGSMGPAETPPDVITRSLWVSTALLLLGLVILPLGGQFMVTAATALARRIGISELVIAITVVAFGTSLPELAASMMAFARKQQDIGIGNIIGSNIFNICFVMGVVPMIRPLSVNPDLMPFHYPVMMYFMLLLILFMLLSRTVSRWMGITLFGSFILYVLLCYSRA